MEYAYLQYRTTVSKREVRVHVPPGTPVAEIREAALKAVPAVPWEVENTESEGYLGWIDPGAPDEFEEGCPFNDTEFVAEP